MGGSARRVGSRRRADNGQSLDIHTRFGDIKAVGKSAMMIVFLLLLVAAMAGTTYYGHQQITEALEGLTYVHIASDKDLKDVKPMEPAGFTRFKEKYNKH